MKKSGLVLIAFILFYSNFNAQEIKVDLINKTKLEKIIKERNGKFLFLNIWATWCAPCREEFPDIVRLAEEYKEKKIEFIGISIDYPDEIASKIIPFLMTNKVIFKNYVNDFNNDEDLINMLDKKWNGALPATFIYDTKGKKLSFLFGSKSYQEFKIEIEKALKKN